MLSTMALPAVPPRIFGASLLFATLCAGTIPGFGSGGAPFSGAVEEHLRIRIEAIQAGAPEAAVVGGEPILARNGVTRYYQRAAFEPVWARSAGPTVLVDSLLAVLRDADRDRLRPADYHVAAIDSLLRHFRAQAGAGEPVHSRRLVDLELLCTDAFLLYGSHLLTGRVDPAAIAPTWTADGRQADLVQHLERPLDLAMTLLRHNEGWTQERLQSAIRGDTEQTVMLAPKVPVHLLYWTAWAEADGPVQFRRDVYDRDEAVRSALAAPPRPLSPREAAPSGP